MDKVDMEIYKILRKDGRAKLVDIGKAINMTHPSVKERLKKLLSNRDIEIKALLNIKKRKFKCAVVNMQLENMDRAIELAYVFSKCPRTIFVAPTTGKYNLNMVLVAENSYILEAVIENTIRPIDKMKVLEISLGEAPTYPEFVDLKVSPVRKQAPCGKRCEVCYLYGKDCNGCPATVYFKGYFGEEK